MALLVAEKPGHAAAAGVDGPDLSCAERERPLGWAGPYERLLVTVTVQEYRRPLRERKLRAVFHQLQQLFLEEPGEARQLRDALVVGQELRVIVAHGKYAARFQPDQRDSGVYDRS